MRRDLTWTAGSSDSAASHFVCMGGFDAGFNGRATDVLVLRSGTFVECGGLRSLSGLQLTSVKPNLSSRRHLRRILMNAHPSLGQEDIPSG